MLILNSTIYSFLTLALMSINIHMILSKNIAFQNNLIAVTNLVILIFRQRLITTRR